jgi:hypothetical protein
MILSFISVAKREVSRLSKRIQSFFETDLGKWKKSQFAAPSPHCVKRTRLIANGLPNATWVETGTYLGDTTFELAKQGGFVITIEPDQVLYAKAVQRFRNHQNVRLINKTSEEALPELVPTLSGNIVFWLDGHYSGGVTHKGDLDTPIREELDSISKSLSKFESVVVAVDDVRCFNPENPIWQQYPSLDFLVVWARDNNLQWHIEHDIFFAKSAKSSLELGSLRHSRR